MIGTRSVQAQIGRVERRQPCALELWLRLLSIDGVGPATVTELLGRYKSIQGFATAVADGRIIELRQASWIVREFRSPGIARLARDRLAAYRRIGFDLLLRTDPHYPAVLAAIDDPPPLLAIRGRLPHGGPAVAIVGSRRASHLGISVALEWSQALAAEGVTVVSGLARGIDRAAHEGALEGGGTTVAVLGSGPDRLYPPEHAGLADRIVASGGAVVSQFWPGTDPVRGLFPVRNRVIAGLAGAVLVVEAGVGSGSLYTARYARAQHKPLFVVPGPVRGHQNKGSNGLLLQEWARAANDVSQIADALGIHVCASAGEAPDLEGDDRMIFKRIDVRGRHVDDLTRELDWVPSRVLRSLLMLQLRGLVRQLPGNRFARTR